LQRALDRLPARLAAAGELDCSAALALLAEAASLIAIGRGPTLALAREAALKLKETVNLHAEAFSGAEFLHGPVALVETRYPILVLMPSDAAAAAMPRLFVTAPASAARTWTRYAGFPSWSFALSKTAAGPARSSN